MPQAKLDLPHELLEYIFQYSPNPLLHRVNRQFYDISTNEQRKVIWLINRYGKETTLSHCWNLKFMNQSIGMSGCKCATAKSRAANCPIEARQMRFVSALLAKGCKLVSGNERCLEVAAKFGHYQLLAYLLYRGGNPNAAQTHTRSWFTKPKIKHKFTQVTKMHRSELRGQKRDSLFLNAVRRNDLLLVEMLLNEPMSPVTDPSIVVSVVLNDTPTAPSQSPLIRIGISESVLSESITLALLENLRDMSQLLLLNGAHTNPSALTTIFIRANSYRILTGSRTAYTTRITIAIQSINLSDFDRHQERILRSCAEIGCEEGVSECLRRGVNINHENGLALYTSLYCGNSLLTKSLLHQNANPAFITPSRFLFCIGMIAVEILAFTLVLLLGIIWVFQVSFGNDVSGLTGMIVPTSLALFVMYRFIPVHSVIVGLVLVRNAQRARDAPVIPV